MSNEIVITIRECPKDSTGDNHVVFFASLITPLKKVATEFIMTVVYQKTTINTRREHLPKKHLTFS